MKKPIKKPINKSLLQAKNRQIEWELFTVILACIAIYYAAIQLGIYHISSYSKQVGVKSNVVRQVLSYAVCNTISKNIPPAIANFSALAIAQVEGVSQKAGNGFCLRVPVLFYHHIKPTALAAQKGQTSLNVDNGFFDNQMAYLVSHGYQTITADRLINALRTHTQLPPKSIVLTIDDGYEDIYTYAYPIFQKYHVIANLAIPSGLIGVHNSGNDYLSWDELKQMTGSGLVSVDNHTWSHASMRAGTLEKDQFEIMTSKHQLEQQLGKPITTFVYPYGETKQSVYPLLQQDGILGAFTTSPGFIQCDSSILALPRNRVGNFSLLSMGL